MPDNNVFRQERRSEKVSMSEFTNQVEDSGTVDADTLQKVLLMQKQAGVNVPKEEEPPRQGHVIPRAKDGIQITGNIPPAMKDMLRQQTSEMGYEQEDYQERNPSPARPMQLTPDMLPQNNALRPGEFYSNDPALMSLIGILNTQNYEKVQLPSLGRFYTDVDAPSGGVIHIRPMTGQEESILATSRFMKSGRGIEMIFKNCIQEQNITPEKLLSIDRTFLLIYLRAISYGNTYEVSIKCPDCSHSFDYDIDLNLGINWCPESFSRANLTKTLPKTGFSFTYRLMTGADETEINSYRERKSKYNNSTDDTFLYKASVLIQEIGTKDSKVTNRYGIQSLLERLPAVDVNYIRNVINDPPFGVKTELEIGCPNCGNTFPTELPYEANFFFPKEKDETEPV